MRLAEIQIRNSWREASGPSKLIIISYFVYLMFWKLLISAHSFRNDHARQVVQKARDEMTLCRSPTCIMSISTS